MRFADFVQINPKVGLKRNLSHPCVMMEDIVPGNRYVSSPRTKEFKGGAVFEAGDTLFARITPCLENGKIAQYVGEPAFGSTEFIVFRGKPGISDNNFIFYLALTDIIRKPAEKSMFGASGRQRADLTAISEIEVPLIPFPLQRKIASILSAYDDLIENNTRRIRLLEEMAQAIYREWFVHFRFPGNEGARMVESPLGMIPEGWEVAYFTDFIDVLSGGTPRTTVAEYWGGNIPWFTPQDLTGSFFVLDTSRKITELGLSKCNSRLYPRNTIFITARGTVGKCIISSVPMAMSQTNYALINRAGYSQYFIFLLTLRSVDRLKKQAIGAVFDTIIVDTFRKLQVIKPPVELVKVFEEQTTKIFLLIENLQKRIINLRQQRDLLLPRLVSGELDVKEMNNGLPESPESQNIK